ncbi:hypothetical protein I3271_07515 [Photobacterium leiognathi]|uniref:HAD domain-containing protein n=1 Tax=Photobacterium leiognathi TaxID=553611 RepID=UPI001EDFE72A|nr:HAD domain-containing protein [Photobacterium leiognathi]MCG3884534.1 hypothetical protein [Photobacterium leiognathi]
MSTNAPSVIFLDIDGVLNSKQHFIYRKSPEGRARRQRIIEKHGQTRIGLELIIIDETKVEILKKLVTDSNLKVVMTSTHRENSNCEYFQTLFDLIGHPLPPKTVIGCTPILGHVDERKRGAEVESWISSNRFTGKFLIIDDDYEDNFFFYQPRIEIDNSIGLTPANAEAIQKYFK